MLKVKDFLKMVGQNLLPSYKVIYDFLDGREEDEKWIFTDLGEVVEELFGGNSLAAVIMSKYQHLCFRGAHLLGKCFTDGEP